MNSKTSLHIYASPASLQHEGHGRKGPNGEDRGIICASSNGYVSADIFLYGGPGAEVNARTIPAHVADDGYVSSKAFELVRAYGRDSSTSLYVEHEPESIAHAAALRDALNVAIRRARKATEAGR